MSGPLYVGGQAWVGNDYVGGVTIIPGPPTPTYVIIGGRRVPFVEYEEPISAWIEEEEDVLALLVFDDW